MGAAGTVSEALGSATDALAAAGVASPRLDAELLLCAATGSDRAALATGPEQGVEAAAGRSFGAFVRRRVSREPIAYILGSKGFRRLELRTDNRALIPRPETEMLVELALELEPRTVLDVGTGSGAIALAIADELPDVRVTATDISPGALALAAENVAALGLGERVDLQAGTLPAAATPEDGFDLVVANLPYVRSDEWGGLAPEITRFEPRGALVGGDDGLEPIRSLLGSLSPRESAGRGLKAGVIAVELAPSQAGEVATLLHRFGFTSTEIRPDLAGHDRIVIGRAGTSEQWATTRG